GTPAHSAPFPTRRSSDLRGIGRAIAEYLLRSGAAVAICGRRRESVDRAAAELKQATGGHVLGVTADVSKWDQVEFFFKTVESRLDRKSTRLNSSHQIISY